MNHRITILINPFIAVLLGLGFLVLPETILGQFGVDGYAMTKLLSQFFGTALLGLGLLLWLSKDVTRGNLQKEMGLALLVGAAAAGLATTVVGTTSGILRANWWMAMVLYTILGVANAYLVFLEPNQLRRA
jgi:hypothetical protein